LQQWKQNSRQHYEAYLQAEEALTANQKLTVRPEPSRLEIAAMFKAAWLSNTDYQFEDACDDGWWIEQADALIEAAKGGVE
jgi:HPt (histidine-containing phosphotransfer) domain-containing protein